MTPAVILLLFFQCCCVSGQLNFSPLVNLALKVSVDEVNKQSSRFNLHMPTSSVVRQLTQVRDNTYDILLNFKIKETVCRKNTRRTDRCHFKQGRFANDPGISEVQAYFSPFLLFLNSKELCWSLVRVDSMSAAPLGISCIANTGALGSSSESSSEEVFFWGTRRFPMRSFS
ncbi:Secreted phosphoprotein 24 [Labeo rohita]|uniref:Secreted phosphoprotein 24 n=1 Tax=Labeo rohita TaxID=84645 RepID=A0ABQ8MF81_LABRO|nr:Secreted phosphoprotein 24 [Labeo rohita]